MLVKDPELQEILNTLNKSAVTKSLPKSEKEVELSNLINSIITSDNCMALSGAISFELFRKNKDVWEAIELFKNACLWNYSLSRDDLKTIDKSIWKTWEKYNDKKPLAGIGYLFVKDLIDRDTRNKLFYLLDTRMSQKLLHSVREELINSLNTTKLTSIKHEDKIIKKAVGRMKLCSDPVLSWISELACGHCILRVSYCGQRICPVCSSKTASEKWDKYKEFIDLLHSKEKYFTSVKVVHTPLSSMTSGVYQVKDAIRKVKERLGQIMRSSLRNCSKLFKIVYSLKTIGNPKEFKIIGEIIVKEDIRLNIPSTGNLSVVVTSSLTPYDIKERIDNSYLIWEGLNFSNYSDIKWLYLWFTASRGNKLFAPLGSAIQANKESDINPEIECPEHGNQKIKRHFLSPFVPKRKNKASEIKNILDDLATSGINMEENAVRAVSIASSTDEREHPVFSHLYDNTQAINYDDYMWRWNVMGNELHLSKDRLTRKEPIIFNMKPTKLQVDATSDVVKNTVQNITK